MTHRQPHRRRETLDWQGQDLKLFSPEFMCDHPACWVGTPLPRVPDIRCSKHHVRTSAVPVRSWPRGFSRHSFASIPLPQMRHYA